MKKIIDQLNKKKALSVSESESVLTDMLHGRYSEQEILRFIESFESKSYHSHEIVGFVHAMKSCGLSLNHTLGSPLMDVCGTGGSNRSRFNVSTCVTFVLSAADFYVAKHGNYGSILPNGSFNFLEELGIPYFFDSSDITSVLEHTYCCFLFARQFHSGMKYIMPARKSYNKRTIFNFLGPLCNPFDVDYQLIGLSTDSILPTLIEAVQQLPIKRVLFCIGGDGKDEVSLAGKTHFAFVSEEGVREFFFDFSTEIESVNLTDYVCGDSSQNAMNFLSIMIMEEWDHPIIKHIAINAAAAFLCYGKVKTLHQGYEEALSLFRTGKVGDAINRYKLFTSEIPCLTH